MSDLEITRLCAEAMGLTVIRMHDIGQGAPVWALAQEGTRSVAYSPLTDDAQAMALVKKFGLWITHDNGEAVAKPWCVEGADDSTITYSDSLNRAICECVAKMRQSEGPR